MTPQQLEDRLIDFAVMVIDVRKAVRNSSVTARNVCFVTVSVPEASLPMKWSEALRHLESAPGYE